MQGVFLQPASTKARRRAPVASANTASTAKSTEIPQSNLETARHHALLVVAPRSKKARASSSVYALRRARLPKLLSPQNDQY